MPTGFLDKYLNRRRIGKDPGQTWGGLRSGFLDRYLPQDTPTTPFQQSKPLPASGNITPLLQLSSGDSIISPGLIERMGERMGRDKEIWQKYFNEYKVPKEDQDYLLQHVSLNIDPKLESTGLFNFGPSAGNLPGDKDIINLLGEEETKRRTHGMLEQTEILAHEIGHILWYELPDEVKNGFKNYVNTNKGLADYLHILNGSYEELYPKLYAEGWIDKNPGLKEFYAPLFSASSRRPHDLPHSVLSARDRLYDLLHSDIGLPEDEWNLLSPELKKSLLDPGEGVRSAAEYVSGQKIEGKRVSAYSFAGGRKWPSTQDRAVTWWPDWMEELNSQIVNTVNMPLFNIAGVDISAANIAGFATMLYGGFAAGKAAIPTIKSLSSQTIKTTLNTGLDKWIATQGRLPKQAQGKLGRMVVSNRTWLIEKATNNLLNRLKRTPNVTQAFTESAKDTVNDIGTTLVPKFTQFGGGMPGTTRPSSSIISGLAGRTPQTAQARMAGVARLIKPEPMELVYMQDRVQDLQGKSPTEIASYYAKRIMGGDDILRDIIKKYNLPSDTLKLHQKIEQIVTQSQPITPQAKEPWQMTRGEYVKAYTEEAQSHLVAGLKDYPDLVKPVTPTAPEEIPIKQIRVDLKNELTRRMKAQEKLPVGVTGPSSINKYVDSMSDSNARDWHSVVIKPSAPRAVAQFGEADAGIQQSMMPQVPAKEVRVQGKGKITQGAELPQKPTVAPVAGVTPPEPPKPVQTTGQPPQPPEEPPIKYSNPEPVPQKRGGIKFAPLQNSIDVVNIATKPDISRKIANLPGLKQFMSALNPSAIAGTPAEKALIIRAVLRDEAIQKTAGVMAYLNRLGDQQKVFGKLDKTGLIASGKLKGKSVNDIRTYPNKYTLTTEQKQWIERANEIEDAKLVYLRENDIEINELTFGEGGHYAGRRVFGKVASDGELLDEAYVSAGPSRVGKKLGFEKHRFYENAEQAIKDGYRYLPEDEALMLNVQGAYNRVADKKMAEWLLSQVPWRTTGAPEELVLAAESARLRMHRSEQLLASLNRALRGERGVPEQILNSIAGAYPAEAQQLRTLITKVRAGEKTGDEVQFFTSKIKAIITSNKADWNAAANARARAREQAISPRYGESAVMHPAFQGKIFIGEDAKKVADTLRNALDAKLIKAFNVPNQLNSVMRYFVLAGDASPFGIQLIFLAGMNPRVYGKAGLYFWCSLTQKEFHSKYLGNNKAIIDRHPNMIISKQGTEFTEAMSRSGIFRKGPFKIAGKVLGPFQQGFECAMDVAGIELAKSLEHMAKNTQELAELDQFINEFRGMTSSARLGVSPNVRALETLAILAPRYNRAIAGLLFDAAKGSIGQGGIRGRLARNNLARGIVAVMAVFIAAGFAMGKDWNEISESLDPRTSKFLTYNIYGTNIGPGSKVRSVIKLLADAIENPDDLFKLGMENPALRFVRGNLSMVLGSSLDLITGKNYIGDPTRDNLKNFTVEMLLGNIMPIWLENFIMEGGTLSQRLLRGSGEFFGGRAYPETDWDYVKRLRNRYAAEEYGLGYDELNNEQKSKLTRKYPELKVAQEKAEIEAAQKGSDIERWYYNELNRITDARNTALNNIAQKLLNGDISRYEYDGERGYIRPYYSGGREVLWSARETLNPDSLRGLEEWLTENQKPEDKALNDYQEYYAELIEKSELPRDWETIDNAMVDFLSKYSAEIQTYILRNKDKWIYDLPEAAKKVEQMRLSGLEDGTWWDNYRENKTKRPFSLTPFSLGGGTNPFRKSDWNPFTQSYGRPSVKRKTRPFVNRMLPNLQGSFNRK